MTLRPLSDLSAADWFGNDPASLLLRTNLGPSGFEAYVRVLHAVTDPKDGTRDEGHLSDPLLATLCSVLARHTTTADECFFALWDGYGDIHGGDSAGFLTAFTGPARWPGRIFTKEKPPPPVPPAFPPPVLAGPTLHANGLDHLLFSGPLIDAGRWGAVSWGHGIPRDINSPNLMWPADHAWFVTTSIEGTWTGVGGSEALVADLLREPGVEVVRARYDERTLR